MKNPVESIINFFENIDEVNFRYRLELLEKSGVNIERELPTISSLRKVDCEPLYVKYAFKTEDFILQPHGLSKHSWVKGLRGMIIFALGSNDSQQLEVYGITEKTEDGASSKYNFDWKHHGPWEKDIEKLAALLTEELVKYNKHMAQYYDNIRLEEERQRKEKEEKERVDFTASYIKRKSGGSL